MRKITPVILLIAVFSFSSSILIAQTGETDKTNALVADFQVNDNGGHSIQNYSAIAADKSGNFIVVWEDQRDEYRYGIDLPYSAGQPGDIFMQRLDSDGNSLGNNFKVNDDDGSLGQHLPAVAASENGNFIVTWVDERDNVYGEDIHNIYAQRFDETGLPLGNNFKVNPEGSNRKVNGYYKSAVAADAFGNFIIVWEESINDTIKIVAQRFENDGTKLGTDFIVNNFPDSEDNSLPKIAMHTSGEFVVTWFGTYTDDRYADIYAQWFSADGVPQGSSIIVDDYLIEEVTISYPKMGMDSEGNVLIAWKDSRNGYHDQAIYAQWFTIAGERLGKNFRINDDQTTLNSYDDDISLAVAPDGSFATTWFDKITYGLSACRFSGDSTASGTSFKLADPSTLFRPPMQQVMAINASGQFMVSWTDESNYTDYSYSNVYKDIFIQRVENDSTFLDEALQINDDSGAGLQLNPAINVDSQGIFTIVWEDPRNDESDIYLRRYNPSGVVLGDQVRVNDDEYGKRNATADVANDSSGQIMVVWEDNRGPSPQIYGQFYSKDGTAIDSNFIVGNGPGEGYYYKPKVASLANGLFIVTWQMSLYNIGAQIYSVEEGPVGAGFYVNDKQDWQERHNPAVAVSDSGVFVIAWEDKRNATAEIYAQRYDFSRQPLGVNFKVNETGGWGIEPSLAFKDDGNLYIVFVGDGIAGQKYGPDGTQVGANISFSDAPAARNILKNPNISFDASGKFIVTWEEVSIDDFTTNIFAQRVTDEGTIISDVFGITNSITQIALQHDLQVWNNRIYTTWIDNLYSGTGWDIFANVLDFDNPNTTAIAEYVKIASQFELFQNYPNPFNPETVISYQLSVNSPIELSIYNVLGQKVQTLVNWRQEAGKYSVNWNASAFASGLYFYQLVTAKQSQIRTMMLVK